MLLERLLEASSLSAAQTIVCLLGLLFGAVGAWALRALVLAKTDGTAFVSRNTPWALLTGKALFFFLTGALRFSPDSSASSKALRRGLWALLGAAVAGFALVLACRFVFPQNAFFGYAGDFLTALTSAFSSAFLFSLLPLPASDGSFLLAQRGGKLSAVFGNGAVWGSFAFVTLALFFARLPLLTFTEAFEAYGGLSALRFLTLFPLVLLGG